MTYERPGDVALVAKQEDDGLAQFGEELSRVLNVRRMTQDALAEAVGRKQSSVSAWLAGKSAPESATVFKIEEILDLPAGHLSRFLGYLPTAAVEASSATFEELVTIDPLLDETQKRMILALYREATSRRSTRRGRPKRRAD